MCDIVYPSRSTCYAFIKRMHSGLWILSRYCLFAQRYFTSSDPHHGISRYIYIYSDIYSDIYLTFYLAFTLTFYLPFFLASILVFYLRSILAFYLTSILTFYLAFSLTFSSGMLSVRVRRGPLRSIALAVEVRQGLL